MDECYVDRSVKTKTHESTMRYIRHWILKPTDDANTITIGAFADRLRRYRTRERNEKLSYGSVKCLFYTMQKERGDTWDIEEMKRVKNTFWVSKRSAFDALRSSDNNLYGTEMTAKISTMILYFASNLFCNTFFNAKLIAVARAVVLTLATNLRASELLQLRKKHLQQMVDGEVVNIRTKKRIKGIRFLSQDWLILKLLLQIRDEPSDFVLVPVSKSFINKCIRAQIPDIPKGVKCGIHSIRKVNTTLLIEHGDLSLAQLFNRHSKSEVTGQYYNNRTYVGPTINRIMRENHHSF